jgi:hypothetical protein
MRRAGGSVLRASGDHAPHLAIQETGARRGRSGVLERGDRADYLSCDLRRNGQGLREHLRSLMNAYDHPTLTVHLDCRAGMDLVHECPHDGPFLQPIPQNQKVPALHTQAYSPAELFRQTLYWTRFPRSWCCAPRRTPAASPARSLPAGRARARGDVRAQEPQIGQTSERTGTCFSASEGGCRAYRASARGARFARGAVVRRAAVVKPVGELAGIHKLRRNPRYA